MGTTAIDAKSALKAIVDALPAFVDMQSTWGFPSRDPEKRWVYFGNIVWESSDWHTNRGRQEKYGIDFAINIQGARSTAEEVESECIRLLELIEEAVKADPRLGGIVVDTSVVPEDLKSWPGAGGSMEAQVAARLDVTARL